MAKFAVRATAVIGDKRRLGMHVLITGGAGFIGSHLVDHHLAQGDLVHVVDNLSTGSRDNLATHFDSPYFRFTEADIVTWSGLSESVGWADRVYHLAAVVGVFRVLEQPIGVMATNIAGCERLLRAVDRCGWKPQVLVTSSSEVYGPRTDPRLSEDMDLIIQPEAPPRWNYAISKLADEAFALSYARVKDIPVTV
ncbi:NAD-dependent epimerase/dehydratase family protein, partial [Guyparkeria halopsychrophila]|uniref:NAD-dependent epimerase/dehydratase family protein n=1 Tax=Guyparkeria halopsychrophila TaxID=3139421 RepID=UPI0037CADA46